MKRLSKAKAELSCYMVRSCPETLQAVLAYAAQNPGLEYANYGTWGPETTRAYRSDSRAITKDWHRTMGAALSCAIQGATDADIIEAAEHNFSGRLKPIKTDGGYRIDYCTGQYWPTEYRRACAVVLEAASRIAYRRHCNVGP